MFIPLDQLIYRFYSLFASAGGGGSGGGNGGGSAIVLVGYIPMHVVGAFIRKAKKEKWLFDGLEVVGWVIALVFSIGLIAWLGFIGFFMAIGAMLGMGAGLYGWFGKLVQSKKTKQALQAAEQQDSAWNEEQLIAHAKDIFMRYQQDWSSYNTTNMQAYMTQDYYNHAALMIKALQQAARRDAVNSPVISQATIVGLDDEADKNLDQVIVGFSAKADDQLIDTRDNEIIFTDKKSFTEYWLFRRSGNNWLLDGIQPGTANKWSRNPELEQFAQTNHYYFSLDWGWLLLPQRGQLFGEGKFGTSDINNHVIGLYDNFLIQLYTYTPKPARSGGAFPLSSGSGSTVPAGKSYLIAQTNVPKNYGDIVVRHKGGLHLFGIRGLNKVSMEWGDFNKKYEVFATNAEQVTSFELLDPVFMEKLEAVPFEVNIEVVDNDVYLYAPEKAKDTDATRYDTMLRLLQEAFKQMRL